MDEQPQRPSVNVLLMLADPGEAARVKRKLTAAGPFVVHTSSSVPRAIALLDQREFEAAILDLDLGDGSGLDVLRAASPRGFRGTSIVLSPDVRRAEAAEAYALGAYEFMLKTEGYWSLLPKIVMRGVERARLVRKVDDLATELEKVKAQLDARERRDPQTALFKHWYLRELYGRELRRIQRYGGTLSVLTLRLTNLNDVASTHGREVANRMVQTAGHLITKELRTSDLAGRLDDASFTLILLGADQTKAQQVTDRLRKLFEDFDARRLLPEAMQVQITLKASGTYEELTARPAVGSRLARTE